MVKKRSQSTRRVARKQPTKALAVRQAAPPITVLPPAGLESTPARALSAEPVIGNLGIDPVAFTAAENAVLNRPVSPADIRMKPSGQPYLSHPTYTRWLNDAFGRGSWALVPVANPMKTDRGVARDFVLYVHGKPVAHATGEQDYSETNRDQTWGDALEACYANGLRRVCKRLGIGLELWDKDFLDAYVAEHCVMVLVKVRGEFKRRWRRKVDARLAGEVRVVQPDDPEDGDDRPQRGQAPSFDRAPAPRRPGEPITEPQARRLKNIIVNAGHMEDTVRSWLKARYGTTLEALPKASYDEVCRIVEQGEALR